MKVCQCRSSAGCSASRWNVAESSPELPLATLRAIQAAVEEGLAACARLAEQKAAVDALTKAVAKGDGAVLARVVAQYESLPGDAVRISPIPLATPSTAPLAGGSRFDRLRQGASAAERHTAALAYLAGRGSMAGVPEQAPV